MGFDQYGFGTNAGYGTSNNGGYGGYGLNGGLGFSNAPYYHPGMDPNGLQADAFQKANGQKKGNPVTGFFKGMAQGAVNTIKSLATPQGLITTAAGAGLIWATGGLAVLPLAAIGAGIGGYQMLKGAANGSAEGVGEGFFTAAASVLGAKFTPKSVKVGNAKYTLQGQNGKGGFMDSVKALFGKRKYQSNVEGAKDLNMYQLSADKARARFGKSPQENQAPPTSSETPTQHQTQHNQTAQNSNGSWNTPPESMQAADGTWQPQQHTTARNNNSATTNNQQPQNSNSATTNNQQPQNSNSATTNNQQPQNSNSATTNNQQPQNSNSATTNNQQPQNSNSATTNNQQPQNSNSATTNNQQPQNSNSATTNNQQPQNSNSATTNNQQPQNSNSATTNNQQPQNSNSATTNNQQPQNSNSATTNNQQPQAQSETGGKNSASKPQANSNGQKTSFNELDKKLFQDFVDDGSTDAEALAKVMDIKLKASKVKGRNKAKRTSG